MFALLTAIFVQATVWAGAPAACRAHNPNSADVPECPANGSALLPDSYPVMAVSVSDQLGGHEFVSEFVTKALRAQSDRPPQFFLNVSDETLKKVRQAVESEAGANPKKRAQWLAALTKVGGASYNWQQDFQQSYVNRSGKPEPRELAHYRETAKDRTGQDSLYPNLGKALSSQCGIKSGDPIFPDPVLTKDGYSGGNIEGGPNGICILGDDALRPEEHADYKQKACGGGTPITAPTSFLAIGHTDEMTATVRTGPGECDLSMLIASPRASLAAMEADPSGPAFAIVNSRGGEAVAKGEMYAICEKFLEGSSPGTDPNEPAGAVREKQGRWLQKILFGERAHAVVATLQGSPEDARTLKMRRCTSMTNGDFIRAYRNSPDLSRINALLDEKMDKFRAEAEEVWKRNAPHCPRRFVEMPMMYGGRLVKKGTEVKGASSLLPNITNLQQFGKTLLIPDPHNEALRQDIRKRTEALGLKADFVNTNPQHAQFGNLHCSTHTLRYCRPRAGASKK